MADIYTTPNWFWSVQDSSPGTQVFKTLNGVDDFVALTDTDYVAWLAAGNTATSIDTAANLWKLFNTYALTTWTGGTLTASIPAPPAGAYDLASPPPDLALLQGNGFQNLRLPKARSPRMLPIGKKITINNTSAVSPIQVQTFGGGSTLLVIPALNSAEFILTDNSTNVGSWTVAARPAYFVMNVSHSRGVVMQKTAATTLGVTADMWAMQKSLGSVIDVPWGRDPLVQSGSASTWTVNIATAGPAAGGRDQAGAFPNNSEVHIYALSDGVVGNIINNFIASLTPPNVLAGGLGGPTMPNGYTHFAYVGSFIMNGANVPDIYQRGAEVFFYLSPVVLNNGAAVAATVVNVAAYVPTIADDFTITVDYIGATTDAAGTVAMSTSFECGQVPGNLFKKLSLQYFGLATLDPIYSPGGDLIFPNMFGGGAPQFKYYSTVTTGTAPVVTARLTSYRVHNGDA